MKIVFEVKENYIEMKNKWATYMLNEGSHLTLNEYGNKNRKLTAFHYVLYAILQDKDPWAGLKNASSNTMHVITCKSKSPIAEQQMVEFFGITKEQSELLFEIAREYFQKNKTFNQVRENYRIHQ